MPRALPSVGVGLAPTQVGQARGLPLPGLGKREACPYVVGIGVRAE